LEHWPGSDGWIGGDFDVELDPKCQRDPGRNDVCRADIIHGMVQAGWWTRNSVEGRPVSVEL
jgi:hypothetical protein